MIRAVTAIGFEGIIAKRKDSFYESAKRSGAWVKYKINKGQEFVIGGYTPGNPFDAVIVGYYQDGKLLYTGKVRVTAISLGRPMTHRKLHRSIFLPTQSCSFLLPANFRNCVEGRLLCAILADHQLPNGCQR